MDLAVPVTTGDHDRVIRIGVDTGGTFTDVVAVDTGTGRIVTTKTPSTPTDPADGFLAGIDKILDLIGAPPGRRSIRILHGTTVATNQLLQGKVGALGFITTNGYESMLEIARQSVPDGYGNSYFWVKPDRIVPADRVRTVGGRLDFLGRRDPAVRSRIGDRGRPVLRAPAGSPRWQSVSCIPTRTTSTSGRWPR